MGAFENSRLYLPRRGAGGPRGRAGAVLPVLAGVAAALLIVTRFQPAAVAPLRGWAIDLAAPAVGAAASATAPLSRLWIGLQRSARSSVDAARIAELEMRVGDLERENADLKRLAHFAGPSMPGGLAARVLMNSASPLSQSILVNAGRKRGVRSGLPVVAGEGLVGRVVQAYAGQAAVMLLSDRLSRVPVAIGPGQTRAVLAGAGGPRPRLEFLAPGAMIAAGDHVTTSGVGGIFPRGLAVGVVAQDVAGWTVELTAGREDPLAVSILMMDGGPIDQLQPASATGAVRTESWTLRQAASRETPEADK